jgi:tetraprenyl-beta-curcumene synthase
MSAVAPQAAETGAVGVRSRALPRAGTLLAHLALLWRFIAIAKRYWVSIYPVIHRELRQWQARAGAIPDPKLRGLAFEAHSGKRGNLEGAAAFAVIVSRSMCIAATRALVAFQGAYDYVDVLSEQDGDDTVASGYRLHLALVAALMPASGCLQLYAHCGCVDDAGYLQAFVKACGAAVEILPSYQSCAPHAVQGARRIAVYQGLNNWGQGGGPSEYARWAAEETPARTGLRWWETGAAAGSSLSVFAAIAAAADASVGPSEASAIDSAYFPWVGALHTLLDSLVDRPADVRAGQHSLVDHYSSPRQAAMRMQQITSTSMRHIEALPRGKAHAMLFAAMICFYLVAPEASLPHALPAREGVVQAIGELARPTMLIMRLRGALHSNGGSTSAPGRHGSEDC